MKTTFFVQFVLATALLGVYPSKGKTDENAGDATYMYCLSNASGWIPSENNRMVATGSPEVLEVTFDVLYEWMTNGGDQMKFVITNELNGWGTSQQFLTKTDQTSIIVPGDGSLRTADQTFSVVYPALGPYTVRFSVPNVALSISSPVYFASLIGGSGLDMISQTIRTSDGGYILAGATWSTDGDMADQGHQGSGDILLVKLTADKEFDTSFGNDGILLLGGSGSDRASTIVQTADGGYLIAGDSWSEDGDFSETSHQGLGDVFVFKLTATGAFDTSFSEDGKLFFGGSHHDLAGSIIVTSSGMYLLAGYTSSSDGDFSGQGAHGGSDAYIMRLTATGELDLSFGGDGVILFGGSEAEFIRKTILETSDGAYLLAGDTFSEDGDLSDVPSRGHSDAFIARFTADGILDAAFGVGGVVRIGGSEGEMVTKILETYDGSYLISGISWSDDGHFSGQGAHGNYDGMLVKLTTSGALDASLGGDGIVLFGGSLNDEIYHIEQTPDGGFILTGQTDSTDGDFAGKEYQGERDIFAVKMTSSGAFDTSFEDGGIALFGGSEADFGTFITRNPDGTYFVAGGTQSSDGDFDGILHHGDIDIVVFDF